jgi:CII-binding regulator of phage lambda lysogenization HflD
MDDSDEELPSKQFKGKEKNAFKENESSVDEIESKESKIEKLRQIIQINKQKENDNVNELHSIYISLISILFPKLQSYVIYFLKTYAFA